MDKFKAVKEFRPDGWDAIKGEVMEEVKKRASNDPDALEVAESLYEMAGTAMLRLIRQKCGTPAVCAEGQIALLTPPRSQLTVPGRPAVPAALRIPMTYKRPEKWSGKGMACFIPDDESLLVKGG